MSLAAVRPSRVFGINTEITIRPITVCSSETPSASLLLTFPHARYLFNCPENTSRSFVQARTPAKYLSAIFLASPRAEHSAGLHGFLLGMADLQREKLIRVVGPHGTRYMAACGRLYTRREGMAVEVLEFPDRNGLERVYEDDHISVYAVGSQPPTIASKRPLGSPRTSPAANKRQKVSSASEGKEEPQKSSVASDSENLDVQAPSTGSKQEKDPSAWLDLVLQDMFRPKAGAQKHPASARPHPTPAYSYEKLEPPTEPINLEPSSYFVVGPKLRGKFSVEKAQALGVQPGPDFGKLWKGEKVVLGDGTTVDGKICVGEGSNGSAFYISNITSLKQLHRTTLPLPQEMTELGQGAQLAAVFHFVGPDILSDERYVDWLSKFEPETKHYLSSHAYSPDLYSFEPAVLLLLKLSLLSPTLFPIPHCRPDSLQSHSIPNLSQLDRFQDIQINWTVPRPPALVRLDYELIKNPVSKSELIQKIELVPEVPEVLDRIQQEEREIQEPASNVFADRIMVTTLGTSSAVPSKYRNVSATLLHIPLNEQESPSDFYYVLLDAGEGTLGQIKRSFGQRWEEVLRAIKLIFISHLHADHHSGLSSILIERSKLAGVLPLVLVCQYGVNLYLRERSLIEPMGLDADSVRWVDVEKLIGTSAPDQARSFEIDNILPQGLKLEPVRVIHWGKCYGLCISHRTQAWKIV
ncbi:hypothetical protein CROQUDRAFT_663319 [Cronartium quercuum f. sp. fusiforme G11]|uniref:ribonuclease Z n=1 Tax=Cronartium quercuum f. sp. fusiforme G11 TaxID=708437 RepID=A0A9P6ND42_9BASI|nr:hypothetical protein CROQUDRAFT_663319 [Cronartium quercuum f. sp. fusiforme G11]